MSGTNTIQTVLTKKDMITADTKGIFLDLDDTLYSYNECNEHAKAKLFNYLQTELNASLEKITEAFDNARKRVHQDLANSGSSHSRLLYIQKLIEAVSGETKCQITAKAHELFWSEFFSKMQLFPDVENFLEKNSDKKIVIVTDLTADIQFKKINHLGLDKYIHFLVTSEEAGIEKPNARMFEMALEKSGLEKKDVVMIGDNFKKDVEGAQSAGIRAIHFNKQPNFFKELSQ